MASRRLATLALLAALGATTLIGCSSLPKEDPRAPIEGRVVDATDGVPIEGAVVIATWWSELPPNPGALALGIAAGGHGSVERRTVYISEALTDRDGRFSIAPWSVSQQWRAGGVTSYSPLIRFYAQGHAPATVGATAWENGLASPTSPGIRRPREIALYAAGQTPRQDLGRRGSSIAEPTAEERRLEEMRRFKAALEADAMEADAPQAPEHSEARERARGAQRHARELIERALGR